MLYISYNESNKETVKSAIIDFGGVIIGGHRDSEGNTFFVIDDIEQLQLIKYILKFQRNFIKIKGLRDEVVAATSLADAKAVLIKLCDVISV